MARGDTPVVVAYVAPAECASLDAFQVLVSTEIARRPVADRTWRWSVHVRVERDGSYQGIVTSEDASFTAASTSCDDVTAALAKVIAEGHPPAPAPEPDREARPRSPAEWRLGGRGELTNHGFNETPYGSPLGAAAVTGGMASLSLEVPGGFHQLEFELGVGRLASTGNAPLTYTVVDTQTCLVDVPFGTSGFSALGCLRLAGASFSAPFVLEGTTIPQNGGALWVGAGGRLRWQARMGIFVEASFMGMYGTVSGGESTTPGWVDVGLGAGFRL
jgi:hypothetical protein